MFLKSKIESLLFIAGRPLSIKKIAELCGAGLEETEKGLEELKENACGAERGILIQKIGNQYSMTTVPESAQIVSEFIKEETTGELTRPQLETMTIVAYRGPVTKLELEQIRGVNCSLILRNLSIRGLIEIEEDDKAMVTRYQISFDFLRHLGLASVKELPDYERLHSHEAVQRIIQEKELGEAQL